MTARRRPFDLAAVAARSAVAGANSVRFDVAHLVPGVEPPDTATPATVPAGTVSLAERIREALVFDAAGLGFRVRTWTPRHPEDASQVVAVTGTRAVSGRPGGEVTADLPDAGPGRASGFRFAGHCAPNPSFPYDQTHATELLLTLSADTWAPDLGDCRMVGLALETLAAAAREAEAPILLLQSPVAPYRDARPSFRKDGAGEEPRPARASAIRMAVVPDPERPERRLAMLRRVTEFAKGTGIGLQLSDSRLGRAPGEWWTVLQPRSGIYRREKDRYAGALSGEPPSEALVVTFVGPARVGSTAAIFADLVARKVGVLAMTEATLQEISFVHAVLPVAPARAGRGSAPRATVRDDLAHGLRHLASECGLVPRRGVSGPRGTGLSAATDYYVLETGPVTLDGFPDGDRGPHTVWVSWNLPADRRVADPAAIVLEQMRAVPQVASAAVDYARVRRLPTGRSRGRAKLSLVLADRPAPESVPRALSVVCLATQTSSIAHCGRLGIDVGEIDLRVAWRERWLGTR